MRAAGVGALLLPSFLVGEAAAQEKEEPPKKVVRGFGWPQALGADVTWTYESPAAVGAAK